MREKDNYKNWDWSQIGKYKNTNLKPKRLGCSACDVVWSKQYPFGINEFRLSSDPFTDPIGVSIIDMLDIVTHPLLENWTTGFGITEGLYGENAKIGDKIYAPGVFRDFGGPNFAPSSWNHNEWGIHELQLNRSCTSASVSKQMKIDFGSYNFIPYKSPTSNPFAPHHVYELQISTALPNGNLIAFAQIHTSIFSQQTLNIGMNWWIIEFDISGPQAVLVNAFNTPNVGGSMWGNPPVLSQSFFGDLVYLQQHNCLLGLTGAGSKNVVTFDLNGNIINSVDMTFTGFNLIGNAILTIFCWDTKIFIHKHQEPSSTPFPQNSEFWEVNISPSGVPLTLTYQASGWPGDYEGLDASSSFECCNTAVITSGCMDSTASNYDPLATADCNYIVGGTDYSCCEYPCHKDLGSGPPPPPSS